MRSRHNDAILHPVPSAEASARTHKNRAERRGERLSILDVREMASGLWAWAGSVSYGPEGQPAMDLADWRHAKAEKCDAFLRSLLEDVGEHIALVIRPPRVSLAPWFVENDAEVHDWRLTEDDHAHIWTHRACPVALPAPLRFTAMHVWKTLSPTERAIVDEALCTMRKESGRYDA